MLPFTPAPRAAVPRDAATVILLRQGTEGPEVFLVKRSSEAAFMANAYVFPGGKLDDADRMSNILDRCVGLDASSAARQWGGSDDQEGTLGLYVTAIRETFEEAGLLLAAVASTADLAAARRRLRDGTPFAEILSDLRSTLRLDRLHPYARWITPAIEPRRFDTRFFLAECPSDQVAEHDAHEVTDAGWLRPVHAVTRDRAGDIRLAPPTLRTLEVLSEFNSVASILRAAHERPPPLIEPVFKEIDGRWVLLLPGDPEHPVKSAALPGPVRYALRDGRWWSQPATNSPPST